MTRPTKKPYGLKELAKTHTVKDIMKLAGATNSVVCRWARDGGFRYKEMKGTYVAMPDDFEEMAAKYNAHQIAKELGVHTYTVTRWAQRIGVTCVFSPRASTKERRPTKEEFIAIAENLVINGVAKHFGVTPSCISQWSREFKFRPRKYCAKCGTTKPGNDFGPNAKTCYRHVEKNPSLDLLKRLHFAYQIEEPVRCPLTPM